jgi:hypothetical protein
LSRRNELDAFYRLLGELRERVGGYRRLAECDGRIQWPRCGVYYFFEDGELREDGKSLRVVRVGTHALTATSRTSLWTRLAQHRGNEKGRNVGGGNHRGSIFRLLVGDALLRSGRFADGAVPSWGKGNSASREVRDGEVALERAVSEQIRSMPLLWIGLEERESRAFIEQNSIALLSNYGREPIDSASDSWLGRQSSRKEVSESGLWNVRNVNDDWNHLRLVELMKKSMTTDNGCAYRPT